jgi:hypothetical protein
MHEGRYRWFEVAFWAFMSDDREKPFALDPGEQAGQLIAPTIGVARYARVPVAVDQGDEGGFVERWLDWLAKAILGELSQPLGMPETSGDAFRHA